MKMENKNDTGHLTKEQFQYACEVLLPNFELNSSSEEFKEAKKAFIEAHLDTMIKDLNAT